MRLNRSHFQRAFTLVEILVVVVIIAILIGILVPTLSGARRSAQKTAATFQLGGLRQSLAQYFSDFNMFPPSSPLVFGTSNQVYSAIQPNHGPSMLAEALLGYLPGSADGAGTDLPFSDTNNFGFRLTKTGGTMGGRIYGPYASMDPKNYDSNRNVFIDPWGHDVLYYRSTRVGNPDPALPVIGRVFGNDVPGLTAGVAPPYNLQYNYYFNSDDCSASTAVNSSGTSTANPLPLISGNAPQLKGFWQLISVAIPATTPPPSASTVNTCAPGVTGQASYLLISAGPDETYFSSGNVVVSK